VLSLFDLSLLVIKDESVGLVLDIMHDKVEKQLKLAKQIKIIEALRVSRVSRLHCLFRIGT
jgi:DNA polymerase II large subunit